MRGRAHPIAALALGVLLLWVAGCAGGGSPSRFYVLAPIADRPGVAAAGAGDRPVSIGVGPVRLPAYVDRPQIVTRKSSDEIDLSEFERWGEPLADAVPRNLADNLGALLPGARIALFPWTGPRSLQYQILVDVTRFDGALGGSTVLEARWRILDADRKELREGRFVVSEPAGGPGYPALVGAMSRSLGALSREIAAALKAV